MYGLWIHYLFLSMTTDAICYLPVSPSSRISEAMCDAGQVSIGYFYFDFRDTDKQHGRDPVLSLLT